MSRNKTFTVVGIVSCMLIIFSGGVGMYFLKTCTRYLEPNLNYEFNKTIMQVKSGFAIEGTHTHNDMRKSTHGVVGHLY